MEIVETYKPLIVKPPVNFCADTLSDFINEIELQNIFNLHGQRIVIDLRDVNFISPSAMTVLGAFCMYIAKMGVLSRGSILTPKNPSVGSYISRMDFYKLLNIRLEEINQRFNSKGRFIELKQFTNTAEAEKITDSLISIFKKQGIIDSQWENTLSYPFIEILENAYMHAESPINAIACAQYYPKNQILEIAVADCGIGFHESLKKNSKYDRQVYDDLTSIDLAIKIHVTSTPNRNSGQGLFFIHEILKENNGDLIIYSGKGLHTMKFQKTVPYWHGSLVCLRFNLGKFVKMTDIFDKFAPPGNDFVILLPKN